MAAVEVSAQFSLSVSCPFTTTVSALLVLIIIVHAITIVATLREPTCIRPFPKLPRVSLVAERFFLLLIAAFSHVYPF
jgi:hypothetical protein